MSDRIAIDCRSVGKMYRLYKRRVDKLLDVSSLGRVLPWWRPELQKFWALRNVNFQLKAGSRLGIIGRNGAGKSTLLKLITGNIAPSEGTIDISGEVQALLEAGAGFHPEFTGYENIEAALIQNGMPRSQIKRATEEIAEFTELGDFLAQPFKTYSAGMQARLVFTTATTIEPDILIVDEILGAGDAYFALKSRARIKKLVESGASILLVSHAMDQILQFCDETIWLDRGQIVMRGESLEVVKAYEERIHQIQDQQIRSINWRGGKRLTSLGSVVPDADTYIISINLVGPSGARADLSQVDLRSGGLAVETLRIGSTQDSDTAHSAYVALDSGGWCDPISENGVNFRSLTVVETSSVSVAGELVIRTFPTSDSDNSLFLRYRLSAGAQLKLSASKNDKPIAIIEEPTATGSAWQDAEIHLRAEPNVFVFSSENDARVLRRWPGEGSLAIERVLLLGGDNQERAVFQIGHDLSIRIDCRANKAGEFPLVYGLAIYRLDGVKVSQHISPRSLVNLKEGESWPAIITFPGINLANGRYVISVSLHRELDPQFPTEEGRYDLIAQSFQFEIVGNPPFREAIYELPAQWDLLPSIRSLDLINR